MKKKLLALLLMSACVFTSLIGCGGEDAKEETSSSGQKFTVGFDAEYPPYGYMDDNGDYTGFDLELAAEVCKLNNWELDNSQVVVVAKDSGISAPADLKDKTVGVQAASAALDLLKSDEEGGQKALSDTFKALQEFADYNTAFVELEAGSIDAIAMDIGVAQYQIKNRGDGKYIILDEHLNSEKYAIGFKLGNEELRDKVNKSLHDLKANGKFDELAKKYELSEMTCLE